MPTEILTQKLLLPELQLTLVKWRRGKGTLNLFTKKTSSFEVCPRCATPSWSTYDRRWVCLKDHPIHGKLVRLHVRKRRFQCKPCGKPFTEPVAGVPKGHRTTHRYRAGLLWACEHFANLKAVRRAYRCSASVLYKTLYERLELQQRKRQYPWPKTIGIDEHYFRREKSGFRRFVTSIVDYKGKRLMEMVEGRQGAQLEQALAHIPGRENVQNVICDLADPYKSFARRFFPNATVVADKFHVLRLLNPALNKRRKQITGDRRSLRVRRWLLRNGKGLDFRQRILLWRWLDQHPELREVYDFKEALHRFYRTKGRDRAERAFIKLIDRMALSSLPEIKRLRRTLRRWKNEILAYFDNRLTNGRTEGFNNKIKLVKRRGYGYRSFRNYRLRCLNACA